ncbi:DUF2141 domain-containing protein [Methylobacterium persicinum]|uniref:Uncharacterized protein (DUF2141 family) n=1 Tax=Methylobacterium persicinum TaxID=374426 RepID=A0ABU0HIH1_9HYPH|nr:DUF2141 domain-containing protein [Methylobacterium persicinum]MDQ0441284.1 uncharacterized protein (DUF2141 family) [Methylobacterium persicinum]GJE40752.1 hypothetical protein KHHGKMAE_4847 [Methylobacterium persicinum]
MRARGRLVAAALLAALPAAASAATVEVEVDGAEAGAGPVFVALCQGGLNGSACGEGDSVQARGGEARVSFRDVAPGVYAVAAFQDTNGNRQLDRTPLGLPLEPYGFSGDVGRRARPDFRSAAFSLSEPGALVRVRLARALPRR